jgi:hypothetical protein
VGNLIAGLLHRGLSFESHSAVGFIAENSVAIFGAWRVWSLVGRGIHCAGRTEGEEAKMRQIGGGGEGPWLSVGQNKNK